MPNPEILSDVGITGVGLISPLGDSFDALAESLTAGRPVIAPRTRFDTAPARCALGAEVPDFNPTDYIKVRGMRVFNRSTTLGLCAAKLALDYAGTDAMPPEEIGLITASGTGYMENLIQYDRAILAAGIRGANPVNVPFSIPSAVGAQIALSLKLKGVSISVGDGHCASMDALRLGMSLVAARRLGACVVLGTFSPFEEMILSADRAGLLLNSNSPDGLRPFDIKRCGTVLGEAGVAFVLESVDSARERGADLLGVLSGISSTYAANGDPGRGAVQAACEQAMAAAGLEPGHIDLVSTGGNGTGDFDREEAAGLGRALGDAAGKPPVMAVKSLCGDMVDAGGMLQVLGAMAAVRGGMVPAIAGLADAEVPGLNYVKDNASAVAGDQVLATSISLNRAAAALVVRVNHA